ncbi:hypothetical protein DAEQUDRAFT_420220 [Daedalea quercina L-15889]|uniref:Uncharacterized protein n=1 Tax=Daedalea quercina L-15889 TaxID=1314783 RepID=A0A165TKX5_9APHY|nr:hypothetical protein DAEQUDRAFT_420220 [Daedalea quercina L-15889]
MMMQEREEQPRDVPVSAVTLSPVSPRGRCRQQLSDSLSAQASRTLLSTGTNAQSPLPRARESASGSPADIPPSDKSALGAVAASESSGRGLVSSSRDFRNRTCAVKSLADRFDSVGDTSGSPTSVTCKAVSALATASVTNFAIASLSPSGLNHTVTDTIDSSLTGVSAENGIHLRPLASYLDSLRETARAATRLQSASTTQERGSLAEPHTAKVLGRSSRDGAPLAALRSARGTDLRLQTTFDRHAQACGAPLPYVRSEVTHDVTSRRALHPRPGYDVPLVHPSNIDSIASVEATQRFASLMPVDPDDNVDEVGAGDEHGQIFDYSVNLFSGYCG